LEEIRWERNRNGGKIAAFGAGGEVLWGGNKGGKMENFPVLFPANRTDGENQAEGEKQRFT